MPTRRIQLDDARCCEGRTRACFALPQSPPSLARRVLTLGAHIRIHSATIEKKGNIS